jgi:hypothetical protein
MSWLAKGVVMAGGSAVVVATAPPSMPRPDLEPEAVPAPSFTIGNDLRVRAFEEAYGPLIDSVARGEDDVVFYLDGRPIHFRDGRMLTEDRSGGEDCDPIFYRYSLEPLTEPVAAPAERPTYCTDVLETLWGRAETEIREHGRSVTFLDHRMFVNAFLVAPLAAVEHEIREAGKRDDSVVQWIAELDITYSFMSRGIAGSPTRSHHAWGLAVDLVPRSYEDRQVYWRWSRVFDREGWDQIPLAHRWSPPLPVIEIFERHGFVWGGKWAHFDVMHFEYRPEIILYNRMLGSSAS